jgi:predicted nucleic acid-binding protein
MIAYADSSYLVAYFDPKSAQSAAVHRFAREKNWDYFWNPLLRAEVRHNLRRIPVESQRTTAWNAYRAVEKWGVRLVPQVFRLETILDRTDALSAADKGQSAAGTWDFAHLAAAEAADAGRFLTCDEAQAKAAKQAGLSVIYFG